VKALAIFHLDDTDWEYKSSLPTDWLCDWSREEHHFGNVFRLSQRLQEISLELNV
jgi:hypothetical protein